MRALWPWLAAVASGVMLALTFAPWNQGWLIWIALVPLLCAVWTQRSSPIEPEENPLVTKLRFVTRCWAKLRFAAGGVSAGGTHGTSDSRPAPHPQTPPPSETEFRSSVRDETEFR